MAVCGAGLLLLTCTTHAQTEAPAPLPDAPSTLLAEARAALDADAADIGDKKKVQPPLPCRRAPIDAQGADLPSTSLGSQQSLPLCENPIQPVVNSGRVLPLNPEQKGLLAIRDVIDPFNLIVIAGAAGLSVAANAHSAYGPGMRGWGRLSAYSVVEDAQGEFFGTYVISSLAHEDPRYHRMPGAPVRKRILHALSHTIISQHDDGRTMLNYNTLLTYPISAELSNLYVPGISDDGPSTARRIALGLVTDPAGNLVAEFLPDLARRIHVHVIFMQQILNEVATGAPNTM